MEYDFPVLTVKKDSTQEVQYYYDREKRHTMAGTPQKKCSRKGVFARNPSLRLLLLDLVFIILMSIGARYLLSREVNRGDIGGSRVQLEMVVVDQRAFCSVEYEGSGERLELTLRPVPSTGELKVARTSGKKGVIKESLALSPETRRIELLVKSGKRELKLYRKVQDRKND